MAIVIKCSTIRGIHRTKVSSHEDVDLHVEIDDSIRHIDPMCMKVMFPMDVSEEIKCEVTWPKNPSHRRYKDQLVKECLGKKVGNVPANLAGFFRKLLKCSAYVKRITCRSTGMKPRPSTRPPTMEIFCKSWSGGKDKRDGGLVLDCSYTIHVKEPCKRQFILWEVEKFMKEHDGDEEIA